MIYHVTTETEWNLCSGTEHYCPQTFLKEQFIHACNRDQLSGVLHRYFEGKKDLRLLHIDENMLASPVKYEQATGNDFFPHIYGVINKTAIVKNELLNEKFRIETLR